MKEVITIHGQLNVDKTANSVKNNMHFELMISDTKYRCVVVLGEEVIINPGESHDCQLICIVSDFYGTTNKIRQSTSLDVLYGAKHVGCLTRFELG